MAAPMCNWEDVLNELLTKARKSPDLLKFGDVSTDHDRIRYLQTKLEFFEFDWIKKYFDSCHCLHQKSVARAASERLAGNKEFQKKQYKNAVDTYTNAIMQGPRNTEELALAFGNRSAAWFHLEEFENCLVDIAEGVRNGYPVSSQHKLDLRRARCQYQLGKFTEAYEALQDFSGHMKEDDALSEKRRDELQRAADDLRSKVSLAFSKSEPMIKEEPPVPDVSYGPNPVLVQASAAVDMQYNDRQGRFLVANRNLSAGDTLIVERPFAAILLPDHYGSHCHHCFAKLLIIFPCRQCTTVKYCSPSCEEKSWLSYHHIECPYLDLLHSIGIAHLSLRIILVAGLQFLLDFRENIKDRKCASIIPGLTESGKYERNYLTVYDLMTHTEEMNVGDLYQYSVTAVLLLRILQHSKWFHEDKSLSIETHDTGETKSNIGSPTSGEMKSNISDEAVVDAKIDMNHTNNVCKTDDERPHTTPCATISNVLENSTIKHSKKGESLKNCTMDIYQNNKTSNCSGVPAKEVHCPLDRASSKCVMANTWDTETYIGGLLLRHIQQLVCNAHAITEVKVTQARENTLVEETSQVRVATAIYPTASLMNHSCDPTIISSFHKDILVVRTVKNVKPGEEIFNCYGPHHKRMRRNERQQCLRDQYFFTCTCDPCKDAADEDLIYSSYSCMNCRGPMVKTSEVILRCRECQHTEHSLDKLDLESEKSSKLFSDGLELLKLQNYKDAICVMSTCYKMRSKLLYKHNSVLAETQDCLARCYAMTGQFKKAAKYLQESIDTVKVIYGTQSIEYANELRKFSEVLISAREWQQALDVTTEAITLFTLHYGMHHETVKDLCEAKTELMSLI